MLADGTSRGAWLIVSSALLLAAIGVTGIARGDHLSQAGVFQHKQLVWIALSLPGLYLATRFPYGWLKRWAIPLFVSSLVALVVVFAFPPRWGARRWIPLGFAYWQPSETAKLTYVLSMSWYLSYRENYKRLGGLVVPLLLTLLPMGLILKEPDLGTALLFLPTLFAMLYAAGARPAHLGYVVLMGLVLSPVLWHGMSAEQQSRITAVFQQSDGGAAPHGDGFHLHQSKQVLALGGMWGSEVSGTRVDDPLAYYLPACRTDFVLCMVGERWGFFGVWSVLLLYAVLFGAGLRQAATTRDPFGRLLVVGVVTQLAAQTIINIGMTVGLLPITGITLPLVSYGGSSLIVTFVALGLVLNVGLRPGYDISRGQPLSRDIPLPARRAA